MAKEKNETMNQEVIPEINMYNDSSESYMRGFITLRNAIIDNCKDCIIDCGKDCLDNVAKPIEDIRCPLQKVRIDFGIAITSAEGPFPA